MKKLLFLLLAIITGGAAMAQDRQAKEILDRLSEKTRSYSTITAEFTISIDNRKDKVKDTQQGKMQLKGSMFKISMKANDIYSNGRVRWTHVKEADEVNLQNVNPNDPSILNNPAKLFNAYLTDFKYTYKGTKKESGVKVQEIHLFPKDLKVAYSQVKLMIEESTGMPKTVIYIGKDGVIYTVRFTRITPNLSMSNAEFVFNTKAHPNVEVIDMR
jgi:outer membrane lipoprotein-sorting protein